MQGFFVSSTRSELDLVMANLPSSFWESCRTRPPLINHEKSTAFVSAFPLDGDHEISLAPLSFSKIFHCHEAFPLIPQHTARKHITVQREFWFPPKKTRLPFHRSTAINASRNTCHFRSRAGSPGRSFTSRWSQHTFKLECIHFHTFSIIHVITTEYYFSFFWKCNLFLWKYKKIKYMQPIFSSVLQ